MGRMEVALGRSTASINANHSAMTAGKLRRYSFSTMNHHYAIFQPSTGDILLFSKLIPTPSSCDMPLFFSKLCMRAICIER